MPSHTIEERLKRNIPAQGAIGNQNVLSRIGQVQDQTRQITPKALEQPLVRVGGVRRPLKGRSVLRDIRGDISPDITRKFKESPGFFETEDVALSTPELLRRQKRRARKAKAGIKPTTIDVTKEAIGPATTSVQLGKKFGTSIGTEEITKTGQRKLILRGPKPAKVSAVAKGGIRAKPGLGEFAIAVSRRRSLLNKAAGRVAGRKGRRADIKSINDSINTLVKQLDATVLTGDDSQRTNILSQIEELSTQRSNLFAGGGSRNRGANFDTPEGFAAFLASKNIPPEERLSLTRRLFANGP